MSNKTGNSCSGPKRYHSSARLDSELLPERSCPSLDSKIETVLRKAVRLRMDADKAHSNLLSRVKQLEEHLSKGTIPTGPRIASIQAKGRNVEMLQAKFDEIVHEAEVEMLEATIENVRSEIKDHQEAIHTASANVDGTIACWKVELLKNEISESKASSLVEAAMVFVKQITKTLRSRELLQLFKRRSTARYPEVKKWMTTRFSCLRRSPSKTSSETKSFMLWPLRNHQMGIFKSLSRAKNLAANAVASNVKVVPRTKKAKGLDQNQRSVLTTSIVVKKRPRTRFQPRKIDSRSPMEKCCSRWLEDCYSIYYHETRKSITLHHCSSLINSPRSLAWD